MGTPELIAHRGYPLRFPENTLPGIAAALRAGARWVEIDVQLTADRVPVLFHDATLERLCAAPGAVHHYSLAALGALRAQDPGRFGERFSAVRIPTLEALATLLGDWPQVTLFVEIKPEAVVQFGSSAVYGPVARALTAIRERAVLISFDHDFLLAAHRQGWTSLGAVVERWDDLDHPLLANILPSYLFTDVEQLPPTGSLVRPGARLAVYEVGDPAIALSLAARGADLIETFAVVEMGLALGELPHG